MINIKESLYNNSILADLNNVVVWIASSRPIISKSSSPCPNPLVTAPRTPITIGIIIIIISVIQKEWKCLYFKKTCKSTNKQYKPHRFFYSKQTLPYFFLSKCALQFFPCRTKKYLSPFLFLFTIFSKEIFNSSHNKRIKLSKRVSG